MEWTTNTNHKCWYCSRTWLESSATLPDWWVKGNFMTRFVANNLTLESNARSYWWIFHKDLLWEVRVKLKVLPMSQYAKRALNTPRQSSERLYGLLQCSHHEQFRRSSRHEGTWKSLQKRRTQDKRSEAKETTLDNEPYETDWITSSSEPFSNAARHFREIN